MTEATCCTLSQSTGTRVWSSWNQFWTTMMRVSPA